MACHPSPSDIRGIAVDAERLRTGWEINELALMSDGLGWQAIEAALCLSDPPPAGKFYSRWRWLQHRAEKIAAREEILRINRERARERRAAKRMFEAMEA